MENKTQEYTILSNFERKVDALACSSCLLSLNAMSMSLAVDVCRMTKYFELLLKSWQGCLPLGDAFDVQFSMWGNKMWEIIQKVQHAFFMNNVHLNQYEYDSVCFLDFKKYTNVPFFFSIDSVVFNLKTIFFSFEYQVNKLFSTFL